MKSLDDVRSIVADLDGTSERQAWGTPSFYVGDKMFARQTEGGEHLAVRIDPNERDAVITTDPGTFSVSAPYEPLPWLLVKISSANDEQLRERLSAARAARLAGLR